MIPFQSVHKEFTEQIEGCEITGKDNSIIGKVICNKYNCGMALVDKDKLETTKELEFKINVSF